PDLHGLILTGRGEAAAIRAERHAPDPVRVTFEGEGFLPGGRVPDLHGLITTGGSEAAAVRAECHATDRVCVSFKGPEVELAKALEIVPFKSTQVGIIRPLWLLLPEPLLDQAHLARFRFEARQFHLGRVIPPVAPVLRLLSQLFVFLCT